MAIKYLDQIDVKGKRVLIRVDYNVPYDKDMQITDDTRITATLPTLKYCLDNGAKVILVSHLGRPKGKPVPEMTLKPAAERLASLLKINVPFIETPVGPDLRKETDALKAGEICLLENIRFYPEEEKNDDSFGKTLASLADVYVDDAFATAHRGHASNDAVTKYVKEVAAGFLLKNEIEYSKKALEAPERPFGVVIGGAKVSSKLDAIRNIINKVDFLIIGGGMAFTFLKAQKKEIGKSLVEDDLLETASEIMNEAKNKKVEFILPVDFYASTEFSNDTPRTTVSADAIPTDLMGLDIGPESIKLFEAKIKSAKTIIWNGPMGAFEMKNYSDGTNAIAKTLADADCISIIGGGDSVTAVNQSGFADKMSYISTGGGAFLELLEGKELPGFKALDK